MNLHMPMSQLPVINATLNATSGVLLFTGHSFIRRGKMAAHRVCMLLAVASSILFLACYLSYHAHVGHVAFRGTGAIRTIYFAMLISHTLLAIALVPLVLVTLTRALRQRFDRHRALARWTYPIWMYVSV